MGREPFPEFGRIDEQPRRVRRSGHQPVLLEDLGAEILCCTPSYALAIADQVEDASQLRLRAGIHGAKLAAMMKEYSPARAAYSA